MIINSGMRTDIPAYFSSWFYNRIKEGFVYVRNPYYPTQVTRYQLTPDVVDCLLFCTKNPKPMLSRLKELEAFKQLWYVTITPYGKEIEPNVPDKNLVMDSFIALSNMITPNNIGWRYDPIFIDETYTLDYHIRSFEHMAKRLSGTTNRCIISFIDLYTKTKRNFSSVREVSKEERAVLGKEFAGIGKQYNIKLYSCCEGTDLLPFGIDCSGCMSQAVVEQAIGNTLVIPKNKSQREGCDCVLGNDIGSYNSCMHGCVYCYANYNQEMVRNNVAQHDVNSPFLIGSFKEGDIMKEAKQESYLDGQMRLF